MAIIGFNFTKLQAEKLNATRGNININNNVSITDVQDATIPLAKEKKGLRLKFHFESHYEPKFGVLILEGDVILLETVKDAEKILEHWKKNHSLPNEMMPPVLNHILEKSNVQALIMARDLGLPAPIPLPKVNMQNALGKKTVAKSPEKKSKKPKKTKK